MDKEISGLEPSGGNTSPDDPTAIFNPKSNLGSIGGNELVRLLGRGGMGEVWLAHDPKLDRFVALKTMRRELAGDESAVSRFYREARSIARLSHPNIIQIFQIGEDGEFIYFLMEFI